MFKPSKNPIVEELTKNHKERRINLSHLRAVRVELPDQRSVRFCSWCTEVRLNHGNQKYCSDNCSQSAMAWANPQKEDALRFLLERQEWKCAICLYDYAPFLTSLANGIKFEHLPWYYFKRLKARVPLDKKPEVDHILAIRHGGQSLGLSNHRAICTTCHKTKTKTDNSVPRNK